MISLPIYVKDIMSKPALKIEQDKSVKDAAAKIKDSRRGFLVVVKSNKPVGVLSDSDIIGRVVAKNSQPNKVKIKDVMTRYFVSINSDEDVLTAVRKMKRGNVHRLPVIDNGKIVGVISLTDIARTSPEMLDLLEYRLKMKEAAPEITEEHTSGICDNCGDYIEDMKRVDDKWLCEDCREDLRSES